MSLDDFMDMDTDDSTKNQTTSGHELLEYDNWIKDENGNIKKLGPYGYSDRDKYEDTIVGELETHGDLFKYNLPIFPHIEVEEKYDRGRRYKHPETKKVLSCVSCTRTELHKINREIIMLDTGSTEKDECLEHLSDRFSKDMTPKTEVYLYFFGKMRHIVKMAMSDEFTNNWDLKNEDRVLKAVYNESYTQEFRNVDTSEKDLKGIDHIREW